MDLNIVRRLFGTIVGLILPIKKVVFFARKNDCKYIDNTKYISEYLHKKRPDVKIIWRKPVENLDYFPSYVEFIKPNSIAEHILLARAQVILDCGNGGRCCSRSGRKRVSLVYNLYTKRRKGQYGISMWHGTPLKKIGKDSYDCASETKFYTSCDYMVAGCLYTKKCLQTAFSLNVPIKMYGTPRNDILFNPTINVDIIKNKLNLPLNKKIIMFAPTYRRSAEYSGVLQMNSIDFNMLFSILSNKFGGEWVFVFRVHSYALASINMNTIIKGYESHIIDGNTDFDMAEYIICSDILLTDYSSCMFDFALTKRPCFLLTPDKEYYENEERGLYMELEQLPFSTALTFDELIHNIVTFDPLKYKKSVEKFLTDIGNVEDGHASERIVDDIIHFIDTRKKN